MKPSKSMNFPKSQSSENNLDAYSMTGSSFSTCFGSESGSGSMRGPITPLPTRRRPLRTMSLRNFRKRREVTRATRRQSEGENPPAKEVPVVQQSGTTRRRGLRRLAHHNCSTRSMEGLMERENQRRQANRRISEVESTVESSVNDDSFLTTTSVNSSSSCNTQISSFKSSFGSSIFSVSTPSGPSRSQSLVSSIPSRVMSMASSTATPSPVRSQSSIPTSSTSSMGNNSQRQMPSESFAERRRSLDLKRMPCFYKFSADMRIDRSDRRLSLSMVGESETELVCNFCLNRGHSCEECPKKRDENLYSVCLNCGKVGHQNSDCPLPKMKCCLCDSEEHSIHGHFHVVRPDSEDAPETMERIKKMSEKSYRNRLRNNWSLESNEMLSSFENQTMKCLYCGQNGHFFSRCPNNNRERQFGEKKMKKKKKKKNGMDGHGWGVIEDEKEGEEQKKKKKKQKKKKKKREEEEAEEAQMSPGSLSRLMKEKRKLQKELESHQMMALQMVEEINEEYREKFLAQDRKKDELVRENLTLRKQLAALKMFEKIRSLLDSNDVEEIDEGIAELEIQRKKAEGRKKRLVKKMKSEFKAIQEQNLCRICFVLPKDQVLIPCGHRLCGMCMTKLEKTDECPFCRNKFTRSQKFFA